MPAGSGFAETAISQQKGMTRPAGDWDGDRDGPASGIVHDPLFSRGARNMLLDYCGLRTGGRSLFICDPSVKQVCLAVEKIAVDEGIHVKRVTARLEWDRIRTHLENGFSSAIIFEFGESHHTQDFIDFLTRREKSFKAYRLFGATAETIRHGFRRRRNSLCARNWSLIQMARRAGQLTIESKRGTRLHVGLDSGASWSNSYGESADGYPGVFPPAEVNTRSLDVDGVLVADGAIGSNVGWPLDARLGSSPITLRILQGKVVDADCRHPLTRDLLWEFLDRPRCNEVAEIGIGTNDGIPYFVPSDILLNERFASFHLGVGSTQSRRLDRSLHLDFMLADCRIWMGTHMALHKRKFVVPNIAKIPDRISFEVNIRLHDAL
jgi:hypothetical protein